MLVGRWRYICLCLFVLEIDVIMFNSIRFEIEDIFGLILCWKFTLFWLFCKAIQSRKGLFFLEIWFFNLDLEIDNIHNTIDTFSCHS